MNELIAKKPALREGSAGLDWLSVVDVGREARRLRHDYIMPPMPWSWS
jgi:hypothetical protein